LTTTRTATSTWTIDPAHSSAEFAVKHLMVSTFKGNFRSLEGTVHLDEDNPASSSVVASVDVASVDTQNPERDAHLRSDDFFNADLYPKMTFRSTRVEQVGEKNWKVIGDLTIRDVTKEVVLDTEYEGRIVDPWSSERIGFAARTELSRKEFGVRWNTFIESGGVVVGDKVRIGLNIEIVRPQS
jgi:polyisoprenoid-binding protein YceI